MAYITLTGAAAIEEDADEEEKERGGLWTEEGDGEAKGAEDVLLLVTPALAIAEDDEDEADDEEDGGGGGAEEADENDARILCDGAGTIPMPALAIGVSAIDDNETGVEVADDSVACDVENEDEDEEGHGNGFIVKRRNPIRTSFQRIRNLQVSLALSPL